MFVKAKRILFKPSLIGKGMRAKDPKS